MAELYRRVLFTIPVSNTDDHLKNHGLLHAGGGRWTLSQLSTSIHSHSDGGNRRRAFASSAATRPPSRPPLRRVPSLGPHGTQRQRSLRGSPRSSTGNGSRAFLQRALRSRKSSSTGPPSTMTRPVSPGGSPQVLTREPAAHDCSSRSARRSPGFSTPAHVCDPLPLNDVPSMRGLIGANLRGVGGAPPTSVPFGVPGGEHAARPPAAIAPTWCGTHLGVSCVVHLR